jgi:hypothetical protein
MDACLQDAFCVYSHVATIVVGLLAFWALNRPAAPMPTIDYSLAPDKRRRAAETPAPVRTKVYTRALALLEEEMGDWYINRMVELELAALFRKKGRVEADEDEEDDDEIVDEDAEHEDDEDADHEGDDEGDDDEDDEDGDDEDEDDEGDDEDDEDEDEDEDDDVEDDDEEDADYVKVPSGTKSLRDVVIAQLNAAVEIAKREAIVDFATHADPAMSPEDRAAAIQRVCEDASRAATEKFLRKED